MTPDERRKLLTRINGAVDSLPGEWQPMTNVGSAADFLVVRDASDDDVLAGLTDLVEDLAADLTTAVELLDADGVQKLGEARALRRPGRPRGTRTHTRDRLVSTFRRLRTNFGRNPTQRELCDNLEPRIAPKTLDEHLTDYGLPWPIE